MINKPAKVSSAIASAKVLATSHKYQEHAGHLNDRSDTAISALLIWDMISDSLAWLLQSQP